jgi:hypothetical protein
MGGNMGEITLDTTVGKVEVWIGSGGELRVFVVGDDGTAIRMIEKVVAEAGELAAVFEKVGLVDREAAWYADHIWKATSPQPEPGLKKRRRDWGERDLPEPIWLGDPGIVIWPVDGV